jgi:cytidylate kinase
MGVITIARQLGAGETTIAPAVAARLGWKVADQSILDREAEITGINLPHAMIWDEHDPTFVERLHGLDPEFAAFLHSSRQVMQELAAQDNVIIVGRGGNLLLRGHPNSLHIKLIADMPFRIRRVMEIRWCSEQVAKELIAKNDRNRALYFRHILRVDWNDPMLYDMVLRTDLLGIERVVDILAECFEHPAPAVASLPNSSQPTDQKH